jgi:hypothetical protein
MQAAWLVALVVLVEVPLGQARHLSSVGRSLGWYVPKSQSMHLVMSSGSTTWPAPHLAVAGGRGEA